MEEGQVGEDGEKDEVISGSFTDQLCSSHKPAEMSKAALYAAEVTAQVSTPEEAALEKRLQEELHKKKPKKSKEEMKREREWLLSQKQSSQVVVQEQKQAREAYMSEVFQLKIRRLVRKCSKRWITFTHIKLREHESARKRAAAIGLQERVAAQWKTFQTSHANNLYSMYLLQRPTEQMIRAFEESTESPESKAGNGDYGGRSRALVQSAGEVNTLDLGPQVPFTPPPPPRPCNRLSVFV